MKLYFLLVRRVPPVPSPVLLEVFDILTQRGFRIEAGIAEEMVVRPERLAVAHDLYILKSHTELALSLAGILHAQGARILNPYLCCTATQDKIVTARRLRAAGVPIPRSWVTGDLAVLQPLIERQPVMIKPYRGHRGAGIVVVHTPHDLAAVPPPEVPMLVQEYIEGSGEDLKVYVVGDDVFAVRKPFSATSFQHPGRPCPVSSELRAIALRCGQVCGLGLYGLDVVESAGGPVVVDVNYFPGYKGVPDVAPRIADYIDQYARGHYGLKLPELEPDHAADALRDAAEADVLDRLFDQTHARVTHAN
ncbi:MAG: ATP-grasp domain-containing protein [Chloroflexota bacterium]|jgi:ribosomal protein S6--L-glutamate ligase|nr:ATP-grasp domain-containing protein [Chloroflexota bacterium]MDQ5854232.1 ATP-grasp domain-containing protein [Chloroflexota bacterium]